jgi:hypothetical protein
VFLHLGRVCELVEVFLEDRVDVNSGGIISVGIIIHSDRSNNTASTIRTTSLGDETSDVGRDIFKLKALDLVPFEGLVELTPALARVEPVYRSYDRGRLLPGKSEGKSLIRSSSS